MPDYLPRNDAAFQNWQANFLTYASEHLAALGLTAEDLAPVTAAQADWDPAYAANNTIQITARSSTQLKNDRRAAYDEAIRELVRRIQASPLVTDDERRALGITVPGDHPTPVGPPSSRPLAIVDPSDRFRHRIRYSDEGSTTSRARPAGIIGCEVWVKVGAAPVDPSEMTFLALNRSSPYIAEYTGTDAGKMAHYMLRWVSNNGQKGPWSETESATITG
jgi:hypothetical protein